VSAEVAPALAVELDDAGNLGQTKIQNLGMAAAADKNVSRLDVAMHDALGVRRFQRFGNFNSQRKQRIGFPSGGRPVRALA